MSEPGEGVRRVEAEGEEAPALGPAAARYYEVEIKRGLGGGGYWGKVFLVDGEERSAIGDTRHPFGGLCISRAAVITRARDIAREHRDGLDLVRLDLA